MECRDFCKTLPGNELFNKFTVHLMCKQIYCEYQEECEFLYKANYSPHDICQLSDIRKKYDNISQLVKELPSSD